MSAVGSQSLDASNVVHRKGSTSGRKAPPSPLSLSSSTSSSRSEKPAIHVNSFSSENSASPGNNAGRNSLESTRSDMTATSIRVSDFPLPPSALPPIPASPSTPRSTSRSQSPATGFPHQLQPPSKLPAPDRIRAESPGTSSRYDSRLGAESYTLDRERHISLSKSQPVTPTTSMGFEDWSVNRDRRSSLQPPRPSYMAETATPRSASPLRNATFAMQQEEFKSPHKHAGTRGNLPSPRLPESAPPQSPLPSPPQSPRNVPPKPPSSPLSIPPQPRDSVRYSHIVRNAGVAGDDLDIEDMLSTEFITEMLSHPNAVSLPSPLSSRFTRGPESPKPASMKDKALDRTGERGGNVKGNDVRAGQTLQSTSDPLPTKIVATDSSGHILSDSIDTPGVQPSETEPSLRGGANWQELDTSGLSSSMFPTKVYEGSSSEPPSPVDPSVVPESRRQAYGTPYSLSLLSIPNTPKSSAKVTFPEGGLRPPVPGTQPRDVSTSQSLATHLPIGGRPLSSPGSPRSPPRIRQHHYPRHATAKKGVYKEETQDDVQVRNMTYPPPPLQSRNTQEIVVDERSSVGDVVPPSAMSSSSSTRTQRGSALPPVVNGSLEDIRQSLPTSTRSFESQNSAAGRTDDDASELEGEIRTANRVPWGATSTVGVRGNGGDKPTIVGLAPAVILSHISVDPPETEASRYNTVYEVDTTKGISPVDLPFIHSRPTYPTDTPESVRSMAYSVDIHGAGNTNGGHPPHDTVYGIVGAYQAPSSMGPMSPNGQLSRPTSNQRAPSLKSVISYITNKSRMSISRLSDKSAHSSRWAWLSRKPLPPLPPGGGQETQEIPKDVPDSMVRFEAILNQRPGNLQTFFDVGSPKKSNAPVHFSTSEKAAENWHDKPSIFRVPEFPSFRSAAKVGGISQELNNNINNNKTTMSNLPPKDFEFHSKDSGRLAPARRLMYSIGKRKRRLLPLIAILIIGIILAIALGATLGRRHRNSAKNCKENTAGVRCNLDATCTCPSSNSDACAAPLAMALVQLIPVASRYFETNITSSALALVLWEVQGTPTGQNCASQANLVDVGSVLDDSVSPNRTQWAQAALLWSLFQTSDVAATQGLRSSVEKMPFRTLTTDGPVSDPSNKFAIFSSGYIFDFANQTVEAPSLTFQNDASPSLAQAQKLNRISQTSLDRMYSFASASSTQQQTALSMYWESVLSLDRNELPTFVSAFKSAPILLPFDATASPGGSAISDLLISATNRTLSFPPPIGCFPGLNDSEVDRINDVETNVFGLPPLPPPAQSFDSSCFPNRPVYGVLDVLRTRLPFSDSRTNVAKQAVVLTSDASTRAVLHVGELLSALPGTPATELSPFALSPRQFGTVSHVNHIALAWLRGFPTTASAIDAAKFVLSSPTSPPAPNSTLSSNFTSIPVVEVAVFGNLFLSDFDSFTSSFATPSGGLFFGSANGDAFRHWALQHSSQANIKWAAGNFAPQVVKEGSALDPNFERIWSGATALISGAPGGVTGPSDVAKVVAAFSGP